MRYHEIINEVRMNPNALKRFANSASTHGIRAGFEAELIFAQPSAPKLDMSADKQRVQDFATSDIDDVVNFFDDPEVAGNSDMINKLYENLKADYSKWKRSKQTVGWGDSEKDFFEANGMYAMSDVVDFYQHKFKITFPEYIPVETELRQRWVDFTDEKSKEFTDEFGYNCVAKYDYHSADRNPTDWVFEYDQSVHPADQRDIVVEVITPSPPMELSETLSVLPKFLQWAKDNGAYTNATTGFHISVSVPNQHRLDFVKLALFLGDQHILESFGRDANTYCEGTLKKIKDRISTGKSIQSIKAAFDNLKDGMIEIASHHIAQKNTERTESINVQEKYVEFRSAGNQDYMGDAAKLQDTMRRAAQALTLACDPEAERNEYHKKLYKLIAPKGNDKTFDLFSEYASGNISSSELKDRWSEITQKTTPVSSGKFELYDKQTKALVDVISASSLGNAWKIVQGTYGNDEEIPELKKQFILKVSDTTQSKMNKRQDFANRLQQQKSTIGKTDHWDILENGKVIGQFSGTPEEAKKKATDLFMDALDIDFDNAPVYDLKPR